MAHRRTCHLFLARVFRLHRLVGLLYLVLFAVQTYCMLTSSNPPVRKLLTWVLPALGFSQAVIASRTFTFLPKTNGQTQGYYTDTRTMSYDWIQENIYFSGLLLFSSFYYSFTPSKVPWPVEVLMVFYPYFTVRRLVPKTSFRGSLNNKDETTEKNRSFMRANIIFIKFFYMVAKGFFVNFAIFTGVLYAGCDHDWLMQMMFLLAGWATTISMFLHTLKYKKYIGARLSMLLYTGSFPFFLVCYGYLAVLTTQHLHLLAFALVGLVLNLAPVYVQVWWQTITLAALVTLRSGAGSVQELVLDTLDLGANPPAVAAAGAGGGGAAGVRAGQ